METQDEEEQVLQGALEMIDHGDFGDTAIEKPKEGGAECYMIDNQQDAANLAAAKFRYEYFWGHVHGPQERSPPLNISCPEKVAELFPSDSDLSSVGMAAQSRSSGSAFSISRPSSMQSGYSDHIPVYLNMSGTRWAQETLESLDLATEQAKKNSSKIDNIQKGTSRRAIRMKDVTSKLCNRMTCLELSQRDMEDRLTSTVNQLEQKVCRWIGKEEEYSDSSQGTCKALPKSMIKCLSWVVPYSDLKQHSVQSISSPPLQLPWVQGLQATLYLLGIGKGQGSHLSIGFSWPKKGKNPKVAESYHVNVTVQIINQEDALESIEKRLLLVTCHKDGGSSAKSSNLNTSIPKLIPISTVEDKSLGYLSDGRLLINISIEDILV